MGDLGRVVRSAERAYDRVTGRLSFVLPTKVPLVRFASSGSVTREQVVTYATSDAVAPQQPHRSRIVLPVAGYDAQLDALMVHELAHLLMCEVIFAGEERRWRLAAMGARRLLRTTWSLPGLMRTSV
jgi:hypothetical protein